MKKPYPLFNLQLLQNKLNMQANLTKEQFNQYTTIIKKWLTVLDKKNTEKDLQQSFLTDFFVNILGYTAQVDSDHKTLWWETKAVTDGKKPDGVLGFNVTAQNADIRAVIELKAGDIDLDKPQNRKNFTGSPVDQAFNYGYSTGGACEFVIVSNFKTIRLYKNGDKSKYHQFILSEMATDNQKIAEFVYLLKFGNLFTVNNNNSVVHSLNTETGKNIANAFYKEYNNIRYQTWQSLIKSNKNKPYGQNFYLYMAQQLIDRIIFIRFCKENNALNNYALEETLSSNKLVQGKYNRLKLFFTAMDQGNPELDIAKFNGGLFAPDQDLDNLEIDDEIVEKIITLYSYNFSSDLDVNILGHIFEQSITDLEALTKNKTTQQRKKDGVFYTPPEITKYIVTNTINNWLTYKSQSITAPKDSKQWWQQYANILKNITVVDPSCGSGAFLVEVFNYLQQEWQKVHNQNVATDYTYQDILTNNIYGVDINPAAVGIAKLSLWLKTAHHKQPLTSLDNNIKIGNSLLDKKELAGFYYKFEGGIRQDRILVRKKNIDKNQADLVNNLKVEEFEDNNKISLAFNWHTEFANVFANGGFDIVVGNPPYVKEGGNKDIFTVLKNHQYYEGKMDLHQLFICQSIDILKNNGYLSFITPNNWITNYGAKKTRKKVLLETSFLYYIDFVDFKVFQDASIQTCIFVLQKSQVNIHNVLFFKVNQNNIKLGINDILSRAEYTEVAIPSNIANKSINNVYFNQPKVNQILDKIKQNSNYSFNEDSIANGIHHHHADINKERAIMLNNRHKEGDGIFTISTKEKQDLNLLEIEESIIKPEYNTEQINRYLANKVNKKWVIYTDSSFKTDLNKINEYPNIKQHLDKFTTVITSINKPYGLHAAKKEFFFKDEKIIAIRKSSNRPRFSYVNFDSYVSATFYIIKPTNINLKYLTCILNSKLIAFWLKFRGKMQGQNYQLDKEPLLEIPIYNTTNQSIENELSELCTNITNLNQILQAQHNQMLQLLETYGVTNINNNLKQWYLLNSQQFFAEITKQNKNFTGALSKVNSNQTFMQYFTEQQQNIKNLQHQINTTDNQIDTMVYNLYNLSKQEITEVEQYLTNHKKETN